MTTPTRRAGGRGLLTPVDRGLPFLHELATGATKASLTPESFDSTHGWSEWLSLGNAPSTGLPGDDLTINGGQEVGDCFFAAIYHGRIVKALVQNTETGVWGLRPGFALPTANQVVGLYLGYQNGLAPGQSADSGPDNGTEPTAGFEWLRKAGIIKRWAPIDPTLLNAATFEHDGVLTAWALDQDAETEFEAHKPWTNHPAASDPIDGGHATYRAAYRPGWGYELTWGSEEPASDAWERVHLQAAYWFQAPWEPDPVGYDLGQLDAALAAL